MQERKLSAQDVQRVLFQHGMVRQVLELPESAHTAKEAASAIGCDISQIAKSLVFRLGVSGIPLLIIASGSNRVNVNRLEMELGEKVKMADPNYVKEHTGFAIGGVPPVAHKNKIRTILDKDLMSYEEIWAAAGHSKAVFRLSAAELLAITSGEVMKVT